MNVPDQPTFQNEPQGDANQRNKSWWWLGGLAVLVLLAGAAFLGGRLLTNRAGPGQARLGPSISVNGSGSMVAVESELKVNPAEELPGTAPDVNGLFDHREDNSFFIKTGNTFIAVKSDQGEAPEVSTNSDGPVVEVVITNQTQIYRDETMLNAPELAESSPIQQVVVPGSLEEIGQNTLLSIWGRKSGDRFIAEILLYSSPIIMQAPK